MLVMVGSAGRAHVCYQLNYSILRRSRHAASGANRAAFNQAANDLCSGLGVQAVHIDYYAKAALECQEKCSDAGINLYPSDERRIQ
jgi:hypothetical protein